MGRVVWRRGRTGPPLGLAGQGQNCRAGMGRHMEPRRLQAVKRGGHGGNQASALRAEQDPERSGQPQLRRRGHSPGQRIVQHENALPGLQAEHQHFHLAGSEIPNQGESRGTHVMGDVASFVALHFSPPGMKDGERFRIARMRD